MLGNQLHLAIVSCDPERAAGREPHENPDILHGGARAWSARQAWDEEKGQRATHAKWTIQQSRQLRVLERSGPFGC